MSENTDIFSFMDEEAETVEQTAAEEREVKRSIVKEYLEDCERRAIAFHEDPNFNMDETNTRFSDVLPLRTVRNKSVAIIGAGGLGNWIWRSVLGMGFENLAIFDDDVIDVENIGPQAHNLLDLGLPKVEAIRRAALQYRGLEIKAIQKRVYNIDEISEILGYVPDVVITATDSAEFRNGFIAHFMSLIDAGSNAVRLPKLLLDFRMSLGDWTCYAIPLYSVALYYYEYSAVRKTMSKYTSLAVFDPSDAVQEPCTARAICYTGGNVASYTGAYLHWFFSKEGNFGRDGEIDSFNVLMPFISDNDSEFSWMKVFSARDWEPVTNTQREIKLQNKIKGLRSSIKQINNTLDILATRILGTESSSFVVYNREELSESLRFGDVFYVDSVYAYSRVGRSNTILSGFYQAMDYQPNDTIIRVRNIDTDSAELFDVRNVHAGHLPIPVFRVFDEEDEINESSMVVALRMINETFHDSDHMSLYLIRWVRTDGSIVYLHPSIDTLDNKYVFLEYGGSEASFPWSEVFREGSLSSVTKSSIVSEFSRVVNDYAKASGYVPIFDNRISSTPQNDTEDEGFSTEYQHLMDDGTEVDWEDIETGDTLCVPSLGEYLFLVDEIGDSYLLGYRYPMGESPNTDGRRTRLRRSLLEGAVCI